MGGRDGNMAAVHPQDMSGQPRLSSVDVFRGAAMAAMVIVNNPGDWAHVYAPLLHAEWNGWTPTDLIFPFFVFIVGVSITLSRRSQASLVVILRRTALLYALGLLLALYPRFNFSTVRLMGVLPRLALCYLAAALVYRSIAGRDPSSQCRIALVAAGSLLVAYWALLTWVPAPGGVAGDLTPSGNLGAWLDRAVLGEAHLWRQSKTWDPEGLFSTAPAIASALTGVAAGVMIARSERRPVVSLRLIVAGIIATVAGLVWHFWFPINKNLWTSSYVLLTSGLAAMLLGALYWVIDVRGYRRFIRPLVVLGVNALTLFVVSGLVVKTMALITVASGGARMTLSRWLYLSVFSPLGTPKNASLLYALANLAVLYVLLEWMFRRRWWLRV